MEVWRRADLHAYVDDCLEPAARMAFEKEMATDSALARRATLWRAQNSAIRSAFDGEGPRAFSINLVRHQNENAGKGRRPSALGARPGREQQTRLSFEESARISQTAGASGAIRPLLSWRTGLASLVLGLVCIWSPATVAPAQGLGAAAVAAYRAFVRPGVALVDFASGDRSESQEWLTTRLAHPLDLPATPQTLSLTGARIAPYPGAPAAFLVYSAQGQPVGLLVQSLDAPATSPPELLSADGRNVAVWTWRGQGFALVGDLDAPLLLKIAEDLFDSPTEAIQAAPERGS